MVSFFHCLELEPFIFNLRHNTFFSHQQRLFPHACGPATLASRSPDDRQASSSKSVWWEHSHAQQCLGTKMMISLLTPWLPAEFAWVHGSLAVVHLQITQHIKYILSPLMNYCWLVSEWRSRKCGGIEAETPCNVTIASGSASCMLIFVCWFCAWRFSSQGHTHPNLHHKRVVMSSDFLYFLFATGLVPVLSDFWLPVSECAPPSVRAQPTHKRS